MSLLVSWRNIKNWSSAQILDCFGYEEPPIPIVDIAQQLGVEVVVDSLPNDIGSVSINNDQAKIIVTSDIRYCTPFVIAHELAHLIKAHVFEGETHYDPLHPINDLYQISINYIANDFASSLLMPSYMIRAYKNLPFASIIANNNALASVFCVTPEIISFRLKKLGYK